MSGICVSFQSYSFNINSLNLVSFQGNIATFKRKHSYFCDPQEKNENVTSKKTYENIFFYENKNISHEGKSTKVFCKQNIVIEL